MVGSVRVEESTHSLGLGTRAVFLVSHSVASVHRGEQLVCASFTCELNTILEIDYEWQNGLVVTIH